MQALPRPSIVPKRFDVKSDRRGVGNWGLQLCQWCPQMDSNEVCIPHIDVKVLWKICRQACCWGRSTNMLHGEVVWLPWSLHTEISKVERSRTECTWHMRVWVRGIHIGAAPGGHKGWWLHGGQGRRGLHNYVSTINRW